MRRQNPIAIPLRIDTPIRNEIIAEYERRIEAVTADDWIRIVKKFDRKIATVLSSDYSFAPAIVVVCRALVRFLEYQLKSCNRTNTLVGLDEKKICAAIGYLVDPDDIIPDHVCGIGYLDDAIVLNLCMQSLSRDVYQKVVAYMKELESN